MYEDDCALRAVLPLHKVFASGRKDYFRLTAKNVARRKTDFTRRPKGCSKNTLRAGGRFFERSLEREGAEAAMFCFYSPLF